MRRINASSQHSLIVGGRRLVSVICTGAYHMVKNGGAVSRRDDGGPILHPKGPGVCRQQKWEFWVAELAESFGPR